jgi:hypothetical protein
MRGPYTARTIPNPPRVTDPRLANLENLGIKPGILTGKIHSLTTQDFQKIIHFLPPKHQDYARLLFPMDERGEFRFTDKARLGFFKTLLDPKDQNEFSELSKLLQMPVKPSLISTGGPLKDSGHVTMFPPKTSQPAQGADLKTPLDPHGASTRAQNQNWRPVPPAKMAGGSSGSGPWKLKQATQGSEPKAPAPARATSRRTRPSNALPREPKDSSPVPTKTAEGSSGSGASKSKHMTLSEFLAAEAAEAAEMRDHDSPLSPQSQTPSPPPKGILKKPPAPGTAPAQSIAGSSQPSRERFAAENQVQEIKARLAAQPQVHESEDTPADAKKKFPTKVVLGLAAGAGVLALAGIEVMATSGTDGGTPQT